jgi:hypothetical protein
LSDRFEEIDQLATHIFAVRHFCTRDVRQPTANDLARDVRLWMELNDFDVAPIAGTNGELVVRRDSLNAADPETKVEPLATPTVIGDWVDGGMPLQHALDTLGRHEWLLVRDSGQLAGILTRADLASPVVSVYLLARLLGMERGLRRLCGTYGHRPIEDEPGIPGRGDGWTMSKAVNEAGKLDKLRADLGVASKKAYEKWTSSAIQLRDRLAHGGSVLSYKPGPSEAIELISRIEHLVAAVHRLVTDRDEVWTSFANTVIESTTLVFAGPNAGPLPLAPPVHVITAQNPHERILTDEENQRRHRLLGDYLRARTTVEPVEVVGRSSEGPWAEDSWAVSGLPREEAVRIGGYFQQRAIFELTEAEVRVIGVDTLRTISAARSR